MKKHTQKSKAILTESFNSVSVKKGDVFTVRLKGNGSTGYLWDLSVTAGRAVLVDTGFKAEDLRACGSGGTYSWVYRAEEAGTVEINAEYKRPWEKNPPEKKISFSVTVGS